MSAAAGIEQALLGALHADTVGEPAGNVTVARGTLDGRTVHVARVESRFASGAIGRTEAERMTALFRVVGLQRSPLVLCLDSAGAKVSEGLGALGAFRFLFRAGLEAALVGTPIAAVLGRNCFGGASMLAHLARLRLFSPGTRLAMSGPAVIAAGSGMDPLDDTFRAMAEAAMSPVARARTNAANRVWEAGDDPTPWLREALTPAADAGAEFRARHAALGARFPKPLPPLAWEPVQRKDLERIYTAGYEAREFQGLLEGHGETAQGREAFIGLAGDRPLGADRAWRFAEAAWNATDARTPALRVFLDCASHATRLEEENLVLTEYVVDMSAALAVAAKRGAAVELTVLGKAGGGVYVALAAPARRVTSVYGAADIQVLPGSAVAAILGTAHEALPSFDDYRAARVADEELKLGLVP